MKTSRVLAALLACLMLSGIGVFAAPPEASAQTPSGNTYRVPVRLAVDDGTFGECPAGTNVIYQANSEGLNEGALIIRFCTVELDGFVPVTTEAECLEARSVGVAPRSGWVPEAGLCWFGGDIRDDLTPERCQGAVFVENLDHPNPDVGMTPACLVPVYKAANVNVVVPDDVVSAWSLEGVIAPGEDTGKDVTIVGGFQFSESYLERIDKAGLILITVNPTVYNGPVPADGVVRFTIPPGFEDGEFTVRATGTDGSQLTFSFRFSDVLPAASSTPRVLPPPPPPELELALTDPYECGGGFTGHITDGTPPYTIGYRIDSAWYSADLGSFVSETGEFETPEGFLDYSQIPEAWYSVSISIADSAQWTRTLTLLGYATEYITDDCGGDATAAPVAVPAAQPADSEQPVGLAVTGATTNIAVLLSQLLLGLGLSTLALLRLSHIRRNDD